MLPVLFFILHIEFWEGIISEDTETEELIVS